MNRPASHKFRGIRYRIYWRHPRGHSKKISGVCSSPLAGKPEIQISPKIKNRRKLRILIDEGIHACIWDLDNDSVDEIATALTEFLWKCGLRFEDE